MKLDRKQIWDMALDDFKSRGVPRFDAIMDAVESWLERNQDRIINEILDKKMDTESKGEA